jgi:crotonobetainyl-CoA:carnitine CoA-transferase CaiB-like acyl-CoA transferase
MGRGPLASIRILDLTQGIAGPYCTKLFADYGADVIKIERPGGGDVARRLGPFPGDMPHHDTGGMFLELNTGKRSVTLNLKTVTGQQILRRLAGDVDLVVESFRPDTLGRLGLDGEVLAEVNPRATLVSISNFGQTGPYRDLEADDLLAYAMGGVLWVTGDEQREPLKIGLYAPLFLAGAIAAAMTFGALWGARRAGIGERVDVSIMDVLAASMDRGSPNLMSWAYSGELATRRTRARRASALPSGVYPCADGYVQVAAQAAWWERFCRTIGRPDLIDDPRLRANLLNPAFADEMDTLFYPWLMQHTKQEIMEKAQAHGLPISALNTMADVFRDPHLRARGFFTVLDHPAAGMLEYPGLPFRMLGTPGELQRAPLLGEHTVEVLTNRLGYTRQDLVILRERNVI